MANANDITMDDIKYEGALNDSHDDTNTDRDNQIITIGNVNSSRYGGKLTLTVYGNDLRIKYPHKMGNVFTFGFCNGEPCVVLGPQCI